MQNHHIIDPSERMISLAAAARQVNVCTRTLVRWSAAGQFPGYLVVNGRKFCFEADVRTWLEKRRNAMRSAA